MHSLTKKSDPLIHYGRKKDQNDKNSLTTEMNDIIKKNKRFSAYQSMQTKESTNK